MSSANQRRNTSGLRHVSGSAKLTFNNTSTAEAPDSRNTLLNKEEEYKRLNAELEKKTANLVFEAEQVLKANEKLIHETDYLNKIGDVNFLDNEVEAPKSFSRASYSAASHLNQNKSAHSLINKRELSQFKDTINHMQEDDADMYANELTEYNEIDEVNDDEGDNYEQPVFVTSKGESAKDIKKLVNRIADEADGEISNVNGLIPSSANDMSSTAQIRFLKAKLKVMQEEVDRFTGELSKKDEENAKLAQRCKELDQDRANQLRISNSHQTQMDKYKKLNDDLQAKLNSAETQAVGLKKENETFKKDTRKNQNDHQQLELRLNRALEEIEKYKLLAQKTSANSRDATDQEKRRVEQLSSDNKRLTKQKTELIQAFKKQLKLIDILKKQKMHLEAAKILQFSEEEFINALEWNSANAGFSSGGPSGASNVKPKPQSQPGSFRSRADPSPRRGTQRPPSGQNASNKQTGNNKFGQKGPIQNHQPQQKRQEPQEMRPRANSIDSEFVNHEEQQIKKEIRDEQLMLDNLNYADYDEDSYNEQDGEDYYRAQLNEYSNEQLNGNSN